jgi:hypothetical protein
MANHHIYKNYTLCVVTELTLCDVICKPNKLALSPITGSPPQLCMVVYDLHYLG